MDTKWKARKIYNAFYYLFTVVFLLSLCIATWFFLLNEPETSESAHSEKFNFDLHNLEEVIVGPSYPLSKLKVKDCNFYRCVNVYKCDHSGRHKLSVYVYPLKKYVDKQHVLVNGGFSKQFMEIVETIVNSEYYTSDPAKACIFIPPIDILNENRIRRNETSQALASLKFWKEGENHLIFNFIPGSVPDYSSALEIPIGKAILAGGGFDSLSYRPGFDVSIPLFNPLMTLNPGTGVEKKWLVISAQPNVRREFREKLALLERSHTAVKIFTGCPGESDYKIRCADGEVYYYEELLKEATFCLVFRGLRMAQPALFDMMKMNCIPVVYADGFIFPFSEVIDWRRVSLHLYERDLLDVMKVLGKVSSVQIMEMRRQVEWVFNKYLSSPQQIALTTLKILNDRVFPYHTRTSSQWNDLPVKNVAPNPLFIPMTSPKAQGFTAVILTYDRLDSLYEVIRNVVLAPSLSKVLVVWNNQKKSPPPASEWPKLNKPLKVVQTKENKLSNRFFPYDEIETEGILAIDDDITMLTADELEFAFEAWREYPDHIVGFPSRTNVWDNSTNGWRYESEWTNDISMVLTGVAFYHKFWNHAYTYLMPEEIRSWVDIRMNCEDIAMNFLVANTTGKAPIKVAPRKKFKCPECQNARMLSADQAHMAERSNCINKFTQVYGRMPLKKVEFRADPVLYKDNFPDKLKKFKDVAYL